MSDLIVSPSPALLPARLFTPTPKHEKTRHPNTRAGNIARERAELRYVAKYNFEADMNRIVVPIVLMVLRLSIS
jgi:hypothetical protein